MRDKHTQKHDKDGDYKQMEEHVDEKAKRDFQRPPYYGVCEQLEKWGVDTKGDVAGGQEHGG